MPVFYTGYNNLGRWAKRMRDGIRNNEPWLDEVKKARLLGIDFDIAARHVFGHKSKKKEEVDEDDKDDDEDVGPLGDIPVEVGEPVEAQAVAAATTMAMARGLLPQFGAQPPPPPYFYHPYPPPPGGQI